MRTPFFKSTALSLRLSSEAVWAESSSSILLNSLILNFSEEYSSKIDSICSDSWDLVGFSDSYFPLAADPYNAFDV